MGRIISFKGIKYASAGRWEYPVEEPAWQEIEDIDECAKHFKNYGDCAYQMRAFVDEATIPEKVFYNREFREGVKFTYSEHCQYLNIWTKTDDNDKLAGQKLPVIVYIHGGSFTTGSSDEKVFEPTAWIESGVIAVTINYRLGPLGFICLPQLASESGHTGNYGLYDQVTALKWIQHNIEVFGGDPDNVTIMGQSAGAMAVTQLVLSPITQGLFAKAFMSSGGGVSTLIAPKSTDSTYDFWRKVMERCGAKTIDEFRAVSPKELYEAWDELVKATKNAGMIASPVVDNILIERNQTDTFKAGRFNHIPIIIGSNSEDIFTPVFYEMVHGWGKNTANYVATNECDEDMRTYTYHFDRQLPGDNKGAWHSSDLWYWFGSLDKGWRPWEQKDYELSKQMIRYLTNFAKTSNPNENTSADEESIIVWDDTTVPGNRAMHFGDEGCVMQRVSFAKTVSAMLFKRNN